MHVHMVYGRPGQVDRARHVPRIGLGLVLALAAAVSAGGCSEGEDGRGGAATAASGEEAPQACYYEFRVGYTCADGDQSIGEWETVCAADASQCGGPDFADMSDYIDGCLFTSEFRDVAWVPAEECESQPADDSDDDDDPSDSGGSDAVGAACGGDWDCREGLLCVTDWPGGYCTGACAYHSDCPGDALCWELEGVSVCLDSCSSDADCRSGYSCDADATCWPD